MVLAFVDGERDIQHIMKRVEKQLEQQNHQLKLDASYSFFTPESSAKLAPMMELARGKLDSMRPPVPQAADTPVEPAIDSSLYDNPAADSAELWFNEI